jgi:hypothetical protein
LASLFGQVWPIDVDLKFLEPVGRELKVLGKVKSFVYLFSSCKGNIDTSAVEHNEFFVFDLYKVAYVFSSQLTIFKCNIFAQ